MQYIKLKSRGSSVSFLQELLGKLGYTNPSSGYFGVETEVAVKDFQSKNHLVDFSKRYQVDLAAIKAVNEVESSGKGFFIDGRPKILFEGHVFWRQLKSRGINPEDFSNTSNSSVLYKNFSKSHYLGGVREYERLDQAASISPDPKFKEAALASASWGSYQVMGFHAIPLGYPSVQQFVDEMYTHERNHLEVFGRYILKNGCLEFLQAKNWTKFAACYNGAAYAQNKYDEKMAKAYLKFSK